MPTPRLHGLPQPSTPHRDGEHTFRFQSESQTAPQTHALAVDHPSASCSGRTGNSALMSCLGRSRLPIETPPQVYPLSRTATDPAAQMLDPLARQSLETQITEIHWLLTKMSIMLNELHQDHVASKVESKMEPGQNHQNYVGWTPVGPSMQMQSADTARNMPALADMMASKLNSDLLPPLASLITASMGDAIQAVEERLKQTYTQQCELWGAQIFQRVRGEFSAQVLSLSRSVETHCQEMNAHSGAFQSISDKMDKLNALSDKLDGVNVTSDKIDRNQAAISVSMPPATRTPRSSVPHDTMWQAALDVFARTSATEVHKMSQKIDNLDDFLRAAITIPPVGDPAFFCSTEVVSASKHVLSNGGASLPPTTQRSTEPCSDAVQPHARFRRRREQGVSPKGGSPKDAATVLMEETQSSFVQDIDCETRISDEFEMEMAAKGAGDVVAPPKLREDSSFSAVFANDTDLGKPLYVVEDLYKETGCAQHLARSDWFHPLSNLMICINLVYIGVEADHNDAGNLYEGAWPYIFAENFFCVFFTAELLVRVLAFKRLRDCLADGWVRFDMFLIATMVLEVWILMPILYTVAHDGGAGANVKIPTGPLRMLRLLKVTRMARMMQAFPELITMVKGMFRSVRAICGSALLVLILLYSFAIFVHMLLEDEDALNDTLQQTLQFDFATIPHCMWTLAMAGVFMLDGAANIATYLVFGSSFNAVLSGWIFIVFILLTAMTVLQMVIGVLCEVISSTAREHEAAKVVAIMKQQLVHNLKQHDDGDGKITQSELVEVLRDPHCKALFRSLNINSLFLLEMQKLMFPKRDSAVAFKPLTEIILNCRGDNPATVDTIAGGLSYLAGELQNSEKKVMSFLATRMDDIAYQLGANVS